MSHLLTSDKEPLGTSQNTEERKARKERKRPTHEDYAQLKPTVVDEDNKKIYEMECLLGQGGFSRVYQVRGGNVSESTKAVLWADKIVSLEMLKRSKNAYQKVQKEISIHRDLFHENIVRLVHDFEDDFYIHIILEHCAMGTLNDVLRARKTVSETEARYYTHQILQGVQFIHHEGLLHCDIKLANMMLSHAMVVKIGDFGLACKIEESQPSGLKGTPNYLAPELLDMQPNWEGSDVWACGIILYSLICGRPPFETNTLEETYDRIKTGDYVKPVDGSLKALQILDSMLTKDVIQRGHLDVEKSLDDYLLTHPFFTESFMPKQLPTCAAFTDEWKFDFFDGAMPSGSPPPEKSYRMSPVDFADREEAMMTEVVNNAELIIVDHGAPIARSLQEPQGVILPQNETHKRFLDRVAQNLQKCQTICSNNKGGDVKIIPVFVKRWVHTNYGFVFELCDNSTGALFDDKSRIAVKGDSVETIDCMNQKQEDLSIRSSTTPYREAITDPGTLAQVKFLEQDGMSDAIKTAIPDNTSDVEFSPFKVIDINGQNKITQIKRWNLNEGCVVMELSNHVVQVEVNQGTLRAIVWEVESPRQMFLTVVDVVNNEVATYSFGSFFMIGYPQKLRPLMDQAFQEITQMLRKRASIIDYVP